MKKQQNIVLKNEKNRIKVFKIGSDPTYLYNRNIYFINSILYIPLCIVLISLLILKIENEVLKIILLILLIILYWCCMYKYGNLISIWTHLVSGWTFDDPNSPEAKEFIKKYHFGKYVKNFKKISPIKLKKDNEVININRDLYYIIFFSTFLFGYGFFAIKCYFWGYVFGFLSFINLLCGFALTPILLILGLLFGKRANKIYIKKLIKNGWKIEK